MATADRPIQYEPHPVSPERKKELIDKGFRILDIKFAPRGTPAAPAAAAAAASKPAATVEELSAADMRAELTARGVEFKPHAPKAALAELLKAAE